MESQNVHLEGWLFQQSDLGISKLRRGVFFDCTSPYLNTETERTGNFRNSAPLQPCPYVPDELKHFKTTFNDVNFSRSPIMDSTEGLIASYAKRFGRDRYEFQVHTLMHAMDFMGVQSTIENGLFLRANQNWINFEAKNNRHMQDVLYPAKLTDLGLHEVSLLWFIPYIRPIERDRYHDFIKQRQSQISTYFNHIAQPARHFYPNHFGVTAAFGYAPNGSSSVLNGAISFNFNDLLASYCSQVNTAGFEVRRYGTEAFPMEIMNALIIHPQDEVLSQKDKEFLYRFPSLDGNPSPKKQTISWTINRWTGIPEFVWKPYSTSANFSMTAGKAPMYRKGRWDQPAIALFLPEALHEKGGFDFSELKNKILELRTEDIDPCADSVRIW